MHVPERVSGATEAAGTAQEEKEEGDERRREGKREQKSSHKFHDHAHLQSSVRGTHLSKHFSVPYHHNPILGSCESHIESAGII